VVKFSLLEEEEDSLLPSKSPDETDGEKCRLLWSGTDKTAISAAELLLSRSTLPLMRIFNAASADS
jgi:hypothetical protein